MQAKEVRLFAGMDRICYRTAPTSAGLRVEDGQHQIDADVEVVVLKAQVVQLVIVELGIAAVLNAEGNFRTQVFSAIADRDVLLGLGVRLGRSNGGAVAIQ